MAGGNFGAFVLLGLVGTRRGGTIGRVVERGSGYSVGAEYFVKFCSYDKSVCSRSSGDRATVS